MRSSTRRGRDREAGPCQRAELIAREQCPLCLAAASAGGCAILAKAKTSARAPPAISCLRVPEAPNFACTWTPVAAANAIPTPGERGTQAAGGKERVCRGRRHGHRHHGDCPTVRMRNTSRPRIVGIGEEQLLAVYLVVGDRL